VAIPITLRRLEDSCSLRATTIFTRGIEHMELAALKGSEKQVSWAQAIRKDRLKVWQQADADSFLGVESILAQQGVSSWWISNKDKSLKEICRQLQGEGARPKAPGKKAAAVLSSHPGRERPPEEVWQTVLTTTGFSRSGPTRNTVSGEIVEDASSPF
jgi:hypothetical protein